MTWRPKPIQPKIGIQQRVYMRKLLKQYGYDKKRVCEAFAEADSRGEVRRASNLRGLNSRTYALILWSNGHNVLKPWITDYCRAEAIKMPSLGTEINASREP